MKKDRGLIFTPGYTAGIKKLGKRWNECSALGGYYVDE